VNLARLAARHGVATSYRPAPDRTVETPAGTVTAVLRALGVDVPAPDADDGAEELLPPTVVWWLDDPRPAWLNGLPAGTTWTVDLEPDAAAPTTATTTAMATGPHDGMPPPGVHALHVRTPDGRTATAHLIAAPPRAPLPPAGTHGLLVQLYSLLSTRSWGMGDLGDLAGLTDWAGRVHGAGFVQVNPLHAGVPAPADGPADPSPYRPASRRYADPVHLRVEEIPEYAHLAGDVRAALRRDAERLRDAVLRDGGTVDRDAVWVLKRRALEAVHAVPLTPERADARRAYLAGQGAALDDHAAYLALAERHGPDHRDWPAPLRDPRSAATAEARRELAGRIAFHRHLAWLTDEQLAAAQSTARAAGMPVGLVHDLAVGVHPGGSDAWAQGDVFARGMSVGAPPDAFNAAGQDWGLPPWRPDRLAATGYAPFRALLRALMRHAGALRIDHVMGLFRLWWVPEGRPPTEGTYVRHDAEAMLAVLVLEAVRAGTYVIGEDLGTVEPGVREVLRERGVLGTSVLWFERDWEGDGRPVPPGEWRGACMATATTHDLPSTAARLSGDDVRLRQRLGLAGEGAAQAAAEMADWRAEFTRLGLLDAAVGGDADPEGTADPAAAVAAEEEAVRAVYRFLRRTPARLVGVWLPDLVGDRRPQNVPGTLDAYPNWRLPVAGPDGRPVTLEELTRSPRARALLREFGTGPGASG
jgi:4-alpha-glucanotransferase